MQASGWLPCDSAQHISLHDFDRLLAKPWHQRKPHLSQLAVEVRLRRPRTAFSQRVAAHNFGAAATPAVAAA